MIKNFIKECLLFKSDDMSIKMIGLSFWVNMLMFTYFIIKAI